MKLLLRICEESEVRVISEYFVSVLKGKNNSPPVDRTSLVQKGGKNYVNIIGTYLSGRAGNGGNLSETEASEDHRNAHHRHCVGTVCVGFPGSFHSVNFCGSAENGIDHYTAESRIIAGFE